MKKHIFSLCTLLFALCTFIGCKGYQPGNLELAGDCLIESVTLNDSLHGVINLEAREVEFLLPEVYDIDSAKITELTISEGATASLAQGQTICLREPRVLTVTNGDAFIAWTLKTRHEEAEILSFKINGIYTGIIDSKRNILVYIPEGLDIHALTPTAELSRDAKVSPMMGVATDFSEPVTYTVTNGSARHQYTVKVVQVGKPEALYVSTAETMTDLNPEEFAACMLMLQNVPNSLYASFDDLRQNKIDISECKVIWWHFHRDGGVNNDAAFELYGKQALDCKTVIQDYLNAGGSLLLTRYATFLPAYLSIGGEAATGRFPNNCWGGNEADAEVTGGPWSFFTNTPEHPIYAGGVVDGNEIFMCDAGYRITNSTAQWHIGTDWGGYPNHEYFTKKTKATVIGQGGDNAIVAWEWARTEKNGGIICIGSGCLDFYSVDEVYTGYHENVDKLTLNAINYLKQ